MEKKLLTIFGASGLVGSSILREALDSGYHVNGTLRDIEKQNRITRLKSLPSGKNAKFFSADMGEISSLDNLNREILEPIVNNLIKKHETNFKGVGQPLRIILTGSKFGPGLYDILISLGKEEVDQRLGNKIT